MGKILLGLVLVVVSFVSFASDEVPVYLWGAGVVGILLIIQGSKAVARGRKVSGEASALVALADDILKRMEEGQSVDRIAADFHVQHGIPAVRTQTYVAALIRELQKSDDPGLVALVTGVPDHQERDSVHPAGELIDDFVLEQTVFYVDETAKRTDGPEGTLILNTAYLYFIVKKNPTFLGNLGKAGMDKLGELPVVGLGVAAVVLVSGLHSELKEYFNPACISALKARFKDERSFAIPLCDISSVQATKRKAKVFTHHFVQITCSKPGEQPASFEFGTSQTDGEAWVRGWIERIQLSAVGEGNMALLSGAH